MATPLITDLFGRLVLVLNLLTLVVTITVAEPLFAGSANGFGSLALSPFRQKATDAGWPGNPSYIFAVARGCTIPCATTVC
jgi:hypothetical protein